MHACMHVAEPCAALHDCDGGAEMQPLIQRTEKQPQVLWQIHHSILPHESRLHVALPYSLLLQTCPLLEEEDVHLALLAQLGLALQ